MVIALGLIAAGQAVAGDAGVFSRADLLGDAQRLVEPWSRLPRLALTQRQLPVQVQRLGLAADVGHLLEDRDSRQEGRPRQPGFSGQSLRIAEEGEASCLTALVA